jgi:hypothetical protein
MRRQRCPRGLPLPDNLGHAILGRRRDRYALDAATSDSRRSSPELPRPGHPPAFRRVIAFAVPSAHGGRSQWRLCAPASVGWRHRSAPGRRSPQGEPASSLRDGTSQSAPFRVSRLNDSKVEVGLRPHLFTLPAEGWRFQDPEHMLPDSLGNVDHVLPPGVVCDRCNHGPLAIVDNALLEYPPISFMRVVRGVPTKAGKYPFAKFDNGTLTCRGPGDILIQTIRSFGSRRAPLRCN